MRVGVEQRRQDRHHPVALGHPDVHVHAPDEHLAAPPLGAVDELGVAVPLGELLVRPVGEGVRARAEEVDARARRPPASPRASVSRRSAIASATVPHTPVTISTVLRSSSLCSRVGSRQPRTGEREEIGGGVGQVPGGLVDERELPLHAQRGGGRGVEVEAHDTMLGRGGGRGLTPTSRMPPWRRGGAHPDDRAGRPAEAAAEAAVEAVVVAAAAEEAEAAEEAAEVARELNLSLDLCLRIGEVLLSSGAGAADVTATMQSVAHHLGLRHPEIDVTFTSLSMSYHRDPAASRRC